MKNLIRFDTFDFQFSLLKIILDRNKSASSPLIMFNKFFITLDRIKLYEIDRFSKLE